MKIIVVGQHHGRTRSFTLGGWAKTLLSVCLLGIPVVLGALLNEHLHGAGRADFLAADFTRSWEEALSEQNRQLQESREQAKGQLEALTLRLAELQARLMRLDALGERLTTIAKLDNGEFDFSQIPAVGGPEYGSPESLGIGEAYQVPDFLQAIDQLGDQIANRQLQLETLEALLTNRNIEQDLFLTGRPVKKGWMSSAYGRRTDPFNGHIAWHNGVDFAGKLGSDVIAVAGGVVTWAGERSGYGEMVEVNHGNGFSTRYAHNSSNLVKVGDVIKKGQVVALMGSSGRSTGPHVHFEVYKHGRAVDPASYIHRTIR